MSKKPQKAPRAQRVSRRRDKRTAALRFEQPKPAGYRARAERSQAKRVRRAKKQSAPAAPAAIETIAEPTGEPTGIAAPRPVYTRRKVPEALPLRSEKISALSRMTRAFKKPAIQEVVREPTAGGIVYRPADDGDIEILLIQDSKGRWTIPKGHIEPGETAKQTAIREIGEEAGLFHIEVLLWLGKIHFQYRRVDKLVLMVTQIYLVRSLDSHETPHEEQWMKGIKWFKFNEALEAIEYEDIERLMLVAKNKIRQGL